MSEEPEEIILNFDYTPPPPTEFRLYYGDDGKVITYTCEKLEGNYIIIDAQIFAEARPDVRVIDNKIVSVINNIVIAKLKPNIVGTPTLKEDISIVDTVSTDTIKWNLDLYELQ